MNVHVTSKDPAECARYLDNARIVLELKNVAKILSSVVFFTKYKDITSLKKPDKQGIKEKSEKHNIYPPVSYLCGWVKWAMDTRTNSSWLVNYGFELSKECVKRHGKRSKDISVIERIASGNMLSDVNIGPLTPFVNSAANTELKIDFTNLPVFDAYKLYLEAIWKKENPTWRSVSEAPRSKCACCGKDNCEHALPELGKRCPFLKKWYGCSCSNYKGIQKFVNSNGLNDYCPLMEKFEESESVNLPSLIPGFEEICTGT